MVGFTVDDFDEDAENAFVESVVSTSNGTINANDVTITNVTDVNITVSNGTIIVRRLGSAKNIVAIDVKYVVNVIIEKIGLTKDTAFDIMFETLSHAISSTEMQTNFNTILQEVKTSKGENFTAVSFQDLELKEDDVILTVLETVRPTAAPTLGVKIHGANDDGNEVTMIWMSIVVVVVFGIFVAAFLSYKHKAMTSSRVTIYDAKSTRGQSIKNSANLQSQRIHPHSNV